jgi:hypothetical protein
MRRLPFVWLGAILLCAGCASELSLTHALLDAADVKRAVGARS